ncbi:MAG: hypothetical protein LBJ72_11855 [Dysgonamonadaceae bacterium]|jgi:hypothetical protein|nr:hypothetical protein [Dysgonamonadaceae bacterium]
MKIIDQTTGELFHLPVDMELEIKMTNPFLSEQGTLSLPVRFPASDHNMEIIEHSDRIMSRRKTKKKRSVSISEGIFFEPATMEIFSVDPKEGITASLYLNESVLYNQMKEVKLPDIFSGIIRDDFSGTETQKVNKWLDRLTQVMIGATEDDFFIFPVRTKVTTLVRINGESHEDMSNRYRALYNTESLNCLYTDFPDSEQSGMPIYNGKKYYRLLAYDVQKTMDGDTEITLPIGYGVTPFLKVTYVLKKIFEHYGYTLSPSILDTNISFKKMCLLNNVADTIVTGKINYGQLVPTVLISEFLDSFRNRFNCEFYVHENKKQIELHFFNDMNSGEPDEDLTPFLDGTFVTEFETPKAVKLTSNRGNEYNKTEYKSYHDLFAKYGNIITIQNMSDTTESGVYFVKAMNAFYEYSKGRTNGSRIGWKLICRNILDYYNPEFESYIEKKSPDEQVAMLSCPFWIVTGLDNRASLINIPSPFVGDVRHLNTTIRYSQSAESSDAPEKEESDGSLSIMYAFSIGRLKNADTNAEYFFGGSTSKYSNDGSTWGDFSLAYDDLYSIFYAGFDNITQTSFLPITTKINLPVEKITTLRMDKLKLLHNQPVMIESIKYTIGNGRMEVKEIKLRTMKTYE